MLSRRKTVQFTVVCLSLLLTVQVFAADKKKGDDAMAHGPMPLEAVHKEMQRLAGMYTVAGKMWMEPGKPPMETTSTAKFTPILNGRFIRQEFQGTMMGQKFEGIGLEGYDSITKKYQSVWLDGTNNSMMNMTGTSKNGGKKIDYLGEMSCPIEKKLKAVRGVYTHNSDGTFTFEMFMKQGKKEFKTMELVYTRKG